MSCLRLTGRTSEGSKSVKILFQEWSRCCSQHIMINCIWLCLKITFFVNFLFFQCSIIVLLCIIKGVVGGRSRPWYPLVSSTIENFKTCPHDRSKYFGLFVVDKMEAINNLVIPPLMKVRRSLVVSHASHHIRTYDDLIGLNGPRNNPEGDICKMMEDVHMREAWARVAGWYPLAGQLIIHHHVGPRPRQTHLVSHY